MEVAYTDPICLAFHLSVPGTSGCTKHEGLSKDETENHSSLAQGTGSSNDLGYLEQGLLISILQTVQAVALNLAHERLTERYYG